MHHTHRNWLLSTDAIVVVFRTYVLLATLPTTLGITPRAVHVNATSIFVDGGVALWTGLGVHSDLACHLRDYVENAIFAQLTMICCQLMTLQRPVGLIHTSEAALLAAGTVHSHRFYDLPVRMPTM